ncbi:MAG: ATP-binding cassette domain-containing protein [Clostridia bacterium]|nr:ATP-binding cassette domain-containing protein [Clostridia bacterium]
MIKVEHLVKNYGATNALSDVSFSVEKGEIVGFLGPNGAGKSTAMNILTGYLAPTSGSVSIDGLDIQKDPIAAKRKIGYLPEQPPLYPDLSVEEYLNFLYELKGCKADREKHLREVAESARVYECRKKLIKTLSKGYKQRVGIAGALVGDPAVLVFDEPTVGLDPKQIIEIRNLIRGLGRSHTVILSTHILQEVQAVCDRILIINKGKLVADERTENIARMTARTRRFKLKIAGPQKEVLALLEKIPGVSRAEVLSERDEDSYTYLVESGDGVDLRKKLFYTLAEKDYPLVGMETLGVNLEEVFLSVVDTAEEAASARRRAPRRNRGRASAETDAGKELFEAAAKKQGEEEKTE